MQAITLRGLGYRFFLKAVSDSLASLLRYRLLNRSIVGSALATLLLSRSIHLKTIGSLDHLSCHYLIVLVPWLFWGIAVVRLYAHWLFHAF